MTTLKSGSRPALFSSTQRKIVTNSDIVRHTWHLFEPCLREQHYEIVEVEFVSQGKTKILRLYIDKPDGGITHEDCVAVSQLLNPMLDENDFISEDYMLEVSSPGIDRPVRKPEDFERFVGEQMKLVAQAPSEGRRRYTGILKGFEDGLILMECGEKTLKIHIENLKKAHLIR